MLFKTSKANYQLVARCFFNRSTGKTSYENYLKYYTSNKQ